jgi:GNAT superfamily N-acetyltransferase
MELRPLTPDRYGDLAALFGTTAITNRCFCTWFLLLDPERRQVWEAGEARAVFERFADAQATPVGVLAYPEPGSKPVGWCAIGPRAAYPRLVKSTVWQQGDPEAWVVTCFYTQRRVRHTGLTRTLLDAAVALAAEHGAAAVEAVPRSLGTPTASGDGYVGFEQAFTDCGFTVIDRPNEKRVLMRRDL